MCNLRNFSTNFGDSIKEPSTFTAISVIVILIAYGIAFVFFCKLLKCIFCKSNKEYRYVHGQNGLIEY